MIQEVNIELWNDSAPDGVSVLTVGLRYEEPAWPQPRGTPRDVSLEYVVDDFGRDILDELSSDEIHDIIVKSEKAMIK
jgi:hypothetical protein